MKKILISLMLALVFCACSKDDDPQMFSVLVNITYDGASASPSIAYMYDYETAKNFDKSYEAACKFGDTRKIYDDKGSEIKAAYTTSSTNGVITFDNVQKGKYIIVAMYKPDGFSYSNFYYYGYAEMNVDHNLPMATFKFTSSSKRGEFIKF